MKRLLFVLFFIFSASHIIAVNVWDGTAEPWINGSGTKNDPFLIETASNLAFLAEKVNEGYQATGKFVFVGTYFMMTEDLDLNNINWTPIGSIDTNMQGYCFGGFFDGWYHTIDNLSIVSDAEVCGLFAGLGGECIMPLQGEIKHVFVTNGNITSNGIGVGGIVGITAGYTRVFQCGYSGSISVTNDSSCCYAGGIVAAITEESVVQECSFSGTVSATNTNNMGMAAAGGIAGSMVQNTEVGRCYNTGSITAQATQSSVAAGIVATVTGDFASFYSCYNVGLITADIKGGILGMVNTFNLTEREQCGQVHNCYFLYSPEVDNGYGEGMTSDEMQAEEFLQYLGDCFVMGNDLNNGYPILGLFDFILWNVKEITCNSAKLSASVHEGGYNVRAVFSYQEWDLYGINGAIEVEVDVVDDYVELSLEDLRPATQYVYYLDVWLNYYLSQDTDLHYFYTEECNAETSEDYYRIQIYPNPTMDHAHLYGVEAAEVRIYSAIGKLVKIIKCNNEINMSDLPEGMYLLYITDSEGVSHVIRIEKTSAA